MFSRTFLAFCLLFAMTGSASAQASGGVLEELMTALSSNRVDVVELSHTYNDTIPAIKIPPNYAQSMPFMLHNISEFEKTGEKGPLWYWNWFWMGEHTGTHVDAPNHWISGRDFESVDEIALDNLILPAVVIDVTSKASADNDYLVSVDDIEAWERTNGRIPDNAMVIMDSGWSDRWPDENNFMNYDSSGMPHSPGFSPEAAKFLTENRQISGFAVDTVSTDALAVAGLTDPPYGVHFTAHSAGKFQVEMIANPGRLPARGALLVVAPLRIEGGSGAPARIFAFVPLQ